MEFASFFMFIQTLEKSRQIKLFIFIVCCNFLQKESVENAIKLLSC